MAPISRVCAHFAALLLALGVIASAAQSKPARRAGPAIRAMAPPAEVMTLHEAVAAAWARHPQRSTLAAQRNVAAANYLAGGALFPNAPTAIGSYTNDRIAGSNYNYITSQAGVSTPVWLPGEGTATQRAAQAQGEAVEGQSVAEHFAVARQVLLLAANATDALNARVVAARRLETSRTLARDMAHRFEVGESSQSDALAAEAEAASAEASLAQAEAQLASARVALATMTGLPAVPLVTGATGGANAAPGEHPLVRAAAQQVQAATAQERLVYLQDRDDPEIGLQGINEKQPGARWDTRFGVTVTFHFATEARNAPRRAAAAEQVTRAQVELELVRRQVGAEVAQARTALAAAERSSVAAERGAAALEKRRGQIERAWRLGEMPFIELVRATALAFDAEAARDKARTLLAAAGLQLRLAEGVLP